MQIQSPDILFPVTKILGYKTKDLKQLRQILNTQARQRSIERSSSWFHLSCQDQKYTIFRCCVVPTCKAYIKLMYLGELNGFIVSSLYCHHDHSKNEEVQELKKHYMLEPYVGKFQPTKLANLQDLGTLHIVRTNTCCKNNPGETAIAYSVTNFKGRIALQNCQKFDDFTVNKGQFTAIMYAMLDCFQNGIYNIQIRSKSKLVIDFMNGASKISAFGLVNIAQAVKLLSSRLCGLTKIKHINQKDKLQLSTSIFENDQNKNDITISTQKITQQPTKSTTNQMAIIQCQDARRQSQIKTCGAQNFEQPRQQNDIRPQIIYKMMEKQQSSVKLQNMCRKILGLQEVEAKQKKQVRR